VTAPAPRERVRVRPGFLRPRVGQEGVVLHDIQRWAGAIASPGEAMTIAVQFPDGAVSAYGPGELERVS